MGFLLFKIINGLVKQVTEARADISQIGFDLDSLQRMVTGLVSLFLFFIF